MAEGDGQEERAAAKPDKPERNTLPSKVKRFIVEQNACYEAPSDVVKSVKAEFKLDVTKQHVEKYDPTKAAGRELSEKLEAHFWATREKYSTLADKNVGSLNYRISMLHAIAQKALARGADKFAADILRQIAEDKGGKYTTRQQISIEDPLGTLALMLGVKKEELPPTGTGEG
jgi:hypothetical protein